MKKLATSFIKQKGFIQIPIFIAIIASGFVFGGVYFFGERGYKNYQAEKIAKEERVQTLVMTQQEALDSAKIEIEELKNKNNQPEIQAKARVVKTEEKKAIENNSVVFTKNIETPEIVVASVAPASAPANPAVQCLSTKSGWDNFVSSLNGLQIVPILDSYSDLAFGTKNRPTSANALFAYNYTRLNSGKSKFYSQTSEVRSKLNVLPPLPYEASTEYNKIKKGYLDALMHLENSYELSLQAFKIFGDNPSGYISQSDINTSQSLFKDSSDEYDQVNPALQVAYSTISKLQTYMKEWKSLGCAFTFNNDLTVKTTINEEYLFTQQYPKSNATGNSGTMLSITTKLPVNINDNGQTKQTLTLLCNPESNLEVFPVSRLTENSVGTIIGATNGRHQCVFTYIGNGRAIYTRMLDFNF